MKERQGTWVRVKLTVRVRARVRVKVRVKVSVRVRVHLAHPGHVEQLRVRLRGHRQGALPWRHQGHLHNLHGVHQQSTCC